MRSKVISQAAWIVILVVTISKRGRATLNIKPSDTVVLLNGSAVFNCSTFNFSSSSEEISSKEISWYHYSTGQRKDVYDDGEIRTNYKGRFRVDKDLLKGAINLIVQALTLEDAGTYECQDEKGFGETASAQLIVLETEPICRSNIHPDGVIGSNDCGIQPDLVEMSCSIAYRGKNPVQLEWRNGLENDMPSLTAVECSNTANRSTCNLNVTGDHARNNSVYVCQTKNIGTNAYRCSSDAIKILYAMSDNTTISKTDEELRCSANSSQQCSYTWTNDGIIVSASERLKPAKSGQYVCRANCTMRHQPCVVTAGNFIFSFAESGNAWPIAVVIVVVIVIAAIIAAIVVVVRRYYKTGKIKKNPRTNDKRENVPLQQNVNTTPRDSSIFVNPTDAVDSPDTPELIIIENAFKANAYIGKGLNGEIYGPGKYKDESCACEKIMFSTNQLTPADDGEVTKKENILSNGRQWMALNHDNLIKFYNIVEQSPAVYIVMEYADRGSVRNALTTLKKDLTMSVVKDWATQIANGMDYLHENGIIYKGLKCARILIRESSTPAQTTLKVTSYDLSCETKTTTPMTFKGMFAWMAPEAISNSEHSNYSDIWSYGVTVWEILTRGIPYQGYNSGDILSGIRSGTLSLKIPESCPKVLRDIFKGCFQLKPSTRPAFRKILSQLHQVD